jgi:diguanylate cyclase (GGDEF)-like protein/PAS domain S-box-containing protein
MDEQRRHQYVNRATSLLSRSSLIRPLAAVLILNLFVVAMSAFVLRRGYQQDHDNAVLVTDNLSRVLDQNLSRLIDKIDLTLLAVADEAEREMLSGGIDRPEFESMLRRHDARLPEANGLRVSNVEGRIAYAVSNVLTPNVDVSDREYFTRQRDDPEAGLFISAPFVGRIFPHPQIIFSRRYRAADGSFAGIVDVSFPIESLMALLSTVDLGRRGMVSLWDRQEQLMSRYSRLPNPSPSTARPSPALVRLILSDAPPSAYRTRSNVDGVERINFFRKVSRWPLYLAIGLAEDECMAGWWQEAYILTGLAGLFVLASIGVSATFPRTLRALHDSEERYRGLFEHMQTGFTLREIVTDKSGKGVDVRFLASNRAYAAIYGLTPEQVVGRTMLEMWPDLSKDTVDWIGIYDEVARAGNPVRFDAYGGVLRRWTEQTIYRTGPGQVAVLLDDISERKRSEARLQLAASVFTHAREGIVITDPDGVIVDVNETFSQITGYGREEAIGKTPRILKSGRHPREFYVAMWQSLADKGHWYGEIWNRRKNGEVYPEMLTIGAVRDADGTTRNYVAMFTDIQTIKEHEEKLEHIAHHDILTNLPNRVLLADRLRHGIAQSQRRGEALAVAYLDLDGFKEINDRYGHNIGDELLVALANQMKAVLRKGDTLARIGGDEFVSILADLEQPQDCEQLLARLLNAASSPVTVGATVLQVSASIGAALCPQDGTDADLLIRQADQAMYLAKQAGRNCYHLFDRDEDDAAKAQSEVLKQVRQALERREFVLHYQPKVNMRTGALIGVEALIRWRHPKRGLLSPAAFLPAVETHPFGVELGEWVIDAALAQATDWRRAGLHLPVSVNVGARQLQQPDFAARLGEQLRAHPDVPPSWLELEILETSALADIGTITALMRACQEMGVRFALDDFGTGYSSLTYLRRLPAELLKIDQTFVRDMLQDRDDRAIVDGVVGLARAFQRDVIAEGVETTRHGRALLSLGCELGQGYGIARPMPAEDVPDWIGRWQREAAANWIALGMADPLLAP